MLESTTNPDLLKLIGRAYVGKKVDYVIRFIVGITVDEDALWESFNLDTGGYIEGGRCYVGRLINVWGGREATPEEISWVRRSREAAEEPELEKPVYNFTKTKFRVVVNYEHPSAGKTAQEIYIGPDEERATKVYVAACVLARHGILVNCGIRFFESGRVTAEYRQD